MRKSVVYVLLLLLFESTVYAGVDTQYLQGMGDVRYHHLDSKIIGRGFHVYVSLPDEYEQSSGETYPTIYVLDGGLLFPLLSSYYGYLNAGGEIPRAIIVGISYGSNDFEDGNHRSTDYTAPSTEREYWADRDDKPWALKTMDLAGHSHMSAPPASFRQGLHWLFSEE